MENYFFILVSLIRLIVVKYGLEAWLFVGLDSLFSKEYAIQDRGSLSIWMTVAVPSSN